MKRYVWVLSIALVGAFSVGASGEWRSLFDGESLDGWDVKAVHGGQGGIWTVEDGAIVANQDADHTGGLLGTDDASFSDFEIELDFLADYPVDSGLFLRTREDGMGYQVTLDYRDGGYVGSLYAPAEGGTLTENDDWKQAYDREDWNHLRARIEGQPPRIQAWLNGVQTLDFTDTTARYPHEGYIGLQVHGGEGSWGENSRARFRNIKVRAVE